MIRMLKVVRRAYRAAAQVHMADLNDPTLVTLGGRLAKLGADEALIKSGQSALGRKLKAAFAEAGIHRARIWMTLKPGWARRSWFIGNPAYRTTDLPLLDEVIASHPLTAHLVGA